MIADNRCRACGHEWQDRPMGFAIHQVCPACGSAYWQWTDYNGATEPRRHTPSISLVDADDA